MLTLLEPEPRLWNQLSRRAFLQVGAIGSLGLTLPGLLRAGSARHSPRAAFGRAQRCILLFLTGGPPQLDTFDLKPDAPAEIRGELRPIATCVPGIRIGELCPRLARQANKFCILRAVTHTDTVHTSAGYTMLTGFPHPQLNAPGGAANVRPTANDHPHLGSLLASVRPTQGSSPPFAALPEVIKDAGVNEFPGQGGGFLGRAHDPFRIEGGKDGFRLPDMVLPDDVSVDRLNDRHLFLAQLQRTPRLIEESPAWGDLERFQEQAFDLIRAPGVRRAFALERESDRLRTAYGSHRFGQGCLLARRLLEAGVALVTVYWHYEGPDDSPVWDTHQNHFAHLRERLVPPADRAVACLLEDLTARGLLADTLVICMGEFGRSPKINKHGGRDHWPHVQSVLMAGAGIPGGSVYGASDRSGAYPAEGPVSPADLAATILHMLGVPAGMQLHNRAGQPVPACAGRPEWDAWYSKLSRLTFDAAGRADVALQYGPAFSTYNETSDLIFRGAKTGLLFGGTKYQGQAENEVRRCQFLGCETGVKTVGWNSMDIWVWYCRFEDCGRGVHNVMGNWHAWNNLFLRSKVADLSTQNLMAFSAVNNTSVGSKCFFDFTTGHTWGSPVSLTGNRVLDPTGDWAIILTNAGPYLVVDNVLRLGGKARGIKMTWGDQTLVGNIYTKADAVEEHGRFRRIGEKIVEPKDVADALPVLPPTPPRRQRKIFEVAAGAGGPAIQEAIDAAAKLAGQRPIVHLPMGQYRIAKSLVIPAGADLQLVGDGGGETATRLEWAGAADGVVLQLDGPSRATLRDFFVNAGAGRALLVDNCDQAGGRIFADQLNASGPFKAAGRPAAVRVNGLDQTNVLLQALQGSGNAGTWVAVLGGPAADTAKNQVSVFTGATGSAAGQYDVRKGGRLVVRVVYHERSSAALHGLLLTDSGTLSIDATRFSYATSAKSATVAAEDFRGLFTLATCMLMPVETQETCRFEIRGDGSKASVLALNNQFWVHKPGTTSDTVWQNKAKPPARGGLAGCNINTSNKEAAPKGFEFLPEIGDDPDPAKSKYGSGPLENRGRVDDATILRHLAPLRAARVWLPGDSAPGASDVRLYRIMASGGRDAVVEFRAGDGKR